MTMRIDASTGLLTIGKCILSPNFDARPSDINIDTIIIHNISLPPGKFSGNAITELFTNTLDPNAHPDFAEIADLKVSCHCLIRRSGQVIQYVPFQKRAWHAGVSRFKGREHCNDFSIGIELEGADEVPYTKKQYATLIKLLRLLISTYKDITLERIVGHSTIAPNRKTDPGPAFDWTWVFAQLQPGLNTGIDPLK